MIFIYLNVAWTIAGTLVEIWACNPPEYDWDRTIEGGVCIFYGTFWLAIMLIEVIIEFCMLLLPITEVRKLYLSTRRKWSVAGVFLLGSLYVPPFFSSPSCYNHTNHCIANTKSPVLSFPPLSALPSAMKALRPSSSTKTPFGSMSIAASPSCLHACQPTSRSWWLSSNDSESTPRKMGPTRNRLSVPPLAILLAPVGSRGRTWNHNIISSSLKLVRMAGWFLWPA